MEWFEAALLSLFLWSGASLTNKYIITNKLRNPTFCISFSLSIGIAVTLLVAPFFGPFPEVAFYPAIAGLSIAIPWLGWYISYYFLIKQEEISRVVALYQTTPLFTLLLASIF